MKRNSTLNSFLGPLLPVDLAFFFNLIRHPIVCFGLFTTIGNAQNAPHPTFRHYTTDDGLASSEIYHIIQDRQGYIWISSDNGVSKFDGYTFRNYGMREGLVENVIFLMQLDSLGRLWMQAMSGRLYYMEGDSVLPYWNNDIITKLKGRVISKGFIVEGVGETIHIATFRNGIVSISKDGSIKTYPHSKAAFRQVLEKDGMAINGYFESENKDSFHLFRQQIQAQKKSDPIYFIEDDKEWSIENITYFEEKGVAVSIHAIAAGKYLYQLFEDLWYIENGELSWHIKFPKQILDAKILKNGKLILGLQHHQGMMVYDGVESLQKGIGSRWLHKESVSYLMEDKDGGRWVATNENGLFYMADDALQVYDKDSGLPDDKITAIFPRNENELYIGLGNGEIYLLDKKENKLTKLPPIHSFGNIRDIYYNAKVDKLWAGKQNLYVLEKNGWQPVNMQLSEATISMSNRITASPNANRIWGCNHYGFMSIEGEAWKPLQVNRGNDQRTLVVREGLDERVWIGKPDGLFQWKNETLLPQNSNHQAFNLRIEDIDIMKDGTLALATKGGGIILWENQEGGKYQTEQINTEDGLTADMLECVYVDNNDVIWAGTLNGLNRINGDRDNRKISQVTVFHGLPSNEINRITSMGKQIWIATNKGLVSYSNTDNTHISSKPRLQSVEANNIDIDLSQEINLGPRKNNMVIHFSTMNFRMSGHIPYRYRMDQGQWVYTQDRSVHFPRLLVGKRLFEVQSKNEDGLWSESTYLPFIIRPYWWNTIWAKFLFLALLLSGAWLFYVFRTQQLIRRHDIQIQLRELEKSALQAQMNPHFIFNCLNSIQSFILQNDNDSAIKYLGNFATLTRSTLNASVLGKIPIREELKLLNSYLELESLRFDNRFTYTVEVAEQKDILDFEIPPLLVQPYVENAIKHGIAGKQSGGKVAVRFEEANGYLLVTITDNGKGLEAEPSNVHQDKLHKSFGMSITSKRLNLLNQFEIQDMVKSETIRDQEGKILGARVEIKISIDHETLFTNKKT